METAQIRKVARPQSAVVAPEIRRPIGAPRPQSAAKKTRFFLVEKPVLRGQDQLLKDLITNEKYAEQRETFKRLAKITKGGTDMSEPVTYQRSAKLS